jgi:hypothetical protein
VTPRQAEAARNAVGQVLQALYNSAQLDVLRRAHELSEAEATLKAEAEGEGPYGGDRPDASSRFLTQPPTQNGGSPGPDGLVSSEVSDLSAVGAAVS